MAWRVARALIQLRVQINEKFPSRSKVADGTIGDAAHASRSSDHNPWIKDGDMGVVSGMDLTHDPLHGLDSEHLAECLRVSRDPRLKYVISNRKIASFDRDDFKWRHYSGKNAHNHHVHISVKADKAHYDNVEEWNIDRLVAPSKAPEEKPHVEPLPNLSLGAKGKDVELLQTKLNAKNLDKSSLLKVDGFFGLGTTNAVKVFQQAHGLTPDGKVGPYTWEKL